MYVTTIKKEKFHYDYDFTHFCLFTSYNQGMNGEKYLLKEKYK